MLKVSKLQVMVKVISYPRTVYNTAAPSEYPEVFLDRDCLVKSPDVLNALP